MLPCSKGDFAAGISILIWGNYPSLFTGPRIISPITSLEVGVTGRVEGRGVREAELEDAPPDFDKGGRGHKQRLQDAWKLGRARKHSPLEAPEGTHPVHTLNLAP